MNIIFFPLGESQLSGWDKIPTLTENDFEGLP